MRGPSTASPVFARPVFAPSFTPSLRLPRPFPRWLHPSKSTPSPFSLNHELDYFKWSRRILSAISCDFTFWYFTLTILVGCLLYTSSVEGGMSLESSDLKFYSLFTFLLFKVYYEVIALVTISHILICINCSAKRDCVAYRRLPSLIVMIILHLHQTSTLTSRNVWYIISITQDWLL